MSGCALAITYHVHKVSQTSTEKALCSQQASGSNKHGQLGLGKGAQPSETLPRRIAALVGLHFSLSI